MNSTRNLAADDLQLKLTTIISLVSTVVNLVGFYVIVAQKTRENRSFTHVQMLYQIALYLSQFYAGTVLNIVFLFPIPGAYCIGWLKDLDGMPALISFILFDVLFAFQGTLLAVLMVLKVEAIARPHSPFKLTPIGQRVFITTLLVFCIGTQVFVLLATHAPRSQVAEFLNKEHPLMIFLLRYPFLWMLTTTRHFVALISSTFACIGFVFIVFVMAYIILIFELGLQVNSMSRASNKYHKRIAVEILIHTVISLQFFILVPLVIAVKFFLDEDVDASIFSAVAFSFFVVAPIPSMLVFILKNPLYRAFLMRFLRFPRNNRIRIAAAADSSKVIHSRMS